MNSKHKILYVDDEDINLMLFSINFEEVYEVITAQDGVSGLEKLESNSDISIVISDMKMPGMNGIDFITKAKEKYSDKKFYILTGFGITDEIEEALSSGLILDYFSKPFEVKKMHQIIASALE